MSSYELAQRAALCRVDSPQPQLAAVLARLRHRHRRVNLPCVLIPARETHPAGGTHWTSFCRCRVVHATDAGEPYDAPHAGAHVIVAGQRHALRQCLLARAGSHRLVLEPAVIATDMYSYPSPSPRLLHLRLERTDAAQVGSGEVRLSSQPKCEPRKHKARLWPRQRHSLMLAQSGGSPRS